MSIKSALASVLTSARFPRAVPFAALLLTSLSTLFIGAQHGIAFYAPWRLSSGPPPSLMEWTLYGLPFAATIMMIIASHELGHYLTARRYRIRSSLPMFIPAPFTLLGTLGAFIIIRSPFPTRRALLDVGLAGPFAGFLVCIPALLIGIAGSRPATGGAAAEGSFQLGEPLILKAATALLWPDPTQQDLLLSPVGLAAWFGLLLTAINLLPIGQLDGGHAAYALFKDKAHRLSSFAFFALVPMSLLAPSWLFFALLAYVLGIRRPHPPTLADGVHLPRSSKVLGVLGLVTFVLCFTPQPIKISWRMLFEEFGGG